MNNEYCVTGRVTVANLIEALSKLPSNTTVCLRHYPRFSNIPSLEEPIEELSDLQWVFYPNHAQFILYPSLQNSAAPFFDNMTWVGIGSR